MPLNVLVFARDNMSVCPVTYRQTKTTFLRSSEVKFFHWKHLDTQTFSGTPENTHAEEKSRAAI